MMHANTKNLFSKLAGVLASALFASSDGKCRRVA